jgi:ABC-2 type transport system permease protein
MSSEMSLGSIIRSEWIKFRTVRSSIMGVVVTFVLTLGLGALVTSLVRAHWSTTSNLDKVTFDPVQTSLIGFVFAQFAVGVIGTLFITSEYTSGSIRTTLASVPNRLELIAAKFIVLIASVFVVGEVAAFATFFMGQAIFSGVVPTASLSNGNVLRAVVLAGVALTLLAALGFTLGLFLRQSAASISVFVSLLLIVPLILIALPQSWRNDITRFLPGELNHAMTSASPVSNDFSAWSAVLVFLIYIIVLLVASTTLFQRRDA